MLLMERVESAVKTQLSTEHFRHPKPATEQLSLF